MILMHKDEKLFFLDGWNWAEYYPSERHPRHSEFVDRLMYLYWNRFQNTGTFFPPPHLFSMSGSTSDFVENTHEQKAEMETKKDSGWREASGVTQQFWAQILLG